MTNLTVEDVLETDCTACPEGSAGNLCSNGRVHFSRILLSRHHLECRDIVPEDVTTKISVRVLRSGEEVTAAQLRPFDPSGWDDDSR